MSHLILTFSNPVINTIKETLKLIHSVERDCEVIYSYLEFLDEFSVEKAFADLLKEFLKLDELKQRQDLLKSFGLEFVKVAPGTFNMGRNKINTRNLTEE